MNRPMSIVRYFMRCLMDTSIKQYETLYRMWTRAIYAGRRDVVAWISVEFPCIFKLNIDYMALYTSAIYHRQGQMVRWVCKKYGIALNCVWSQWMCLSVVVTNQLKELQWLRQSPRNCPWDLQKCLKKAKAKGYTKMAAWIQRQAI